MSKNKELLPANQEWKQLFPVDTRENPQWYAVVILTESIPIKYVSYARIDWIENFGKNYHTWDRNKTYRCYISPDLRDDPVFTLQHRKKFLHPYPCIYTVRVKRTFGECVYIISIIIAYMVLLMHLQ